MWCFVEVLTVTHFNTVYVTVVFIYLIHFVIHLIYCLCCCFSSQGEREELKTEYKQKYERERVLLMEENKKLSSELDKVRHRFTLRTI